MHTSVKDWVIDAFGQLGEPNCLAKNQFPILKISLGLNGVDACLFMDVIMADPVDGDICGKTH